MSLLNHVIGQIFGVGNIKEGALGVEVRNHNIGVVFGTVLQSHALGLTVTHNNFIDVGVTNDLAPVRQKGLGQGIGYSTHTAPGKTPGANVAINIAHVMVQQYISRTRRVHSQRRTDNAATGKVGL